MGDLVTERRWRYTLIVAGQNFGVWDTKDGGDLDTEEQKYARGDMGPEEAFASKPTRENITLD